MTFGEKLKKIREERDISQKLLAEQSGVSQQTIGSYETEFRTPTWKSVQLIAKALGLTCADLTDDEPESEPEVKPKKKGK